MFKNIIAIVLLIGLVSACTSKTTSETVNKTKSTANDFRKMAPTAGPAPKIQLAEYETFKLPNGLTVILAEDHSTPAVTYNLTIDQPPFLEGDKAGYSSMAGSLLSMGTKSRTKAEIDESIDFIGATLATHANGIYANSLTKHTDKLLEIISDVLLNPNFPEAELAKLKKQELSGLAQAKDDPNAIARNVSGVLKYGKNHPYGEIVTEQTVNNITRTDCEKFYKEKFIPNIAYLVVTGDMNLVDLKKKATQYFGAWKKGKVVAVDLPPVSPPTQTSIDFVNKPAAVQSLITVTYPVEMKPGTDDVIKARVANALLGGFFGSRLNKNLREDKAYTYGARSSLNADRYVGSFRASSSVRNIVTDSSITQFLYEMKRMNEAMPGVEELNRVKSVLAGQFARSMEDKATVARFALNTMKYNLPKDYYANYLRKLSAVTPEDVLAMSKKYIKPEQAYIVVVGNQDKVIKSMKGMAPAGGVNFYDINGDKVEAPKRSIVGLTAQKVIDDYILAIGGADAVHKVKNIKSVFEASMQGQTIKLETVSSVDDRALVTVSMGGNVMQKIVYANGKGVQEAMGQKMPMSENEITGMKEKIYPVKEAVFDKLGVKMELKGIENLDGKEAYKVITTAPSGKVITVYFDADTGLKLQEMLSEQGMNIVSKFSDYKAVNGVKFPFTISQTGMAPMPIVFKAKSMEANVTLKDDDFIME